MIATREAVFQYRGSSFVLGPVSFQAGVNQVWAVVGSNGAGKSTLFHLINGETKPSSGSVECTGSVELVPQGVEIPGWLTIWDTYQYLAALRGVRRKSIDYVVADALELVNLRSVEDQSVRSLSGGQKRRAVIGQAVLGCPATILMDEPSAGLDLDQRAALKEAVAGLARNCAIILSSHIVEDLAGLATHVLHLRSGRVSYVGDVQGYLAGVSQANQADETNVAAWNSAYQYWNKQA